MKNGSFLLSLFALVLPLSAQQLTLTPLAISTFDVALPGPYPMGTVSVIPARNITVTLTTNTNWLWFSPDGTCDNITQSFSPPLSASGSADIQVCLEGIPTGGMFVGLVTASAQNLPSVSVGVSVGSFPGGNVTVTQQTADVSQANQTVIFNDFTDGSTLPPDNQPALTAAEIAYAPGSPLNWLITTEFNDQNQPVECKGLILCEMMLSANPNTPGLVPGTAYAASVAFQDVTNGNIASVTVTYVVPAPLSITSPASFTSLINQAFSATLYATGGAGSYTFSSTSLPAGLTLSPAGILSGAVPTSGSSQATITVRDSNGLTASQNLSLTFNQPLLFVPLTPCRVVDTRWPPGNLGGPFIAGGTSRDFALKTGNCSIPAEAQAYSLNVTVKPSGPLGYLTAWPTGESRPNVSTLNSTDGRTKANAAIVPAGTNGAVTVFASDNTDLILDINGYFVAAAAFPFALGFHPITPCRIADTRQPGGTLGGPTMSGGSSRDFSVSQNACGIPPYASAYSLNFTVIPSGPLGYLTTWPAGSAQPTVSTLNAKPSVITANAAIVPAGGNGNISVFASDNTDLVIDVNGYFSFEPGLSFYIAAPCRVLNTRTAAGAFQGPLDVNFQSSPCSVPVANAYAVNTTALPTTSLGYLKLWPQGQNQPNASTLNARDGVITSNMSLVSANTANSSISTFASDLTQLLIDVFGYFAP